MHRYYICSSAYFCKEDDFLYGTIHSLSLKLSLAKAFRHVSTRYNFSNGFYTKVLLAAHVDNKSKCLFHMQECRSQSLLILPLQYVRYSQSIRTSGRVCVWMHASMLVPKWIMLYSRNPLDCWTNLLMPAQITVLFTLLLVNEKVWQCILTYPGNWYRS